MDQVVGQSKSSTIHVLYAHPKQKLEKVALSDEGDIDAESRPSLSNYRFHHREFSDPAKTTLINKGGVVNCKWWLNAASVVLGLTGLPQSMLLFASPLTCAS